jgi:hypothetical protein
LAVLGLFSDKLLTPREVAQFGNEALVGAKRNRGALRTGERH